MKRTARCASLTFAVLLSGILAHAQPTPLVLRGGAVSTGLSGYYDYQSNGGSPGWLRVDPNDPQKIYTSYMLSLQGGDTLTVSNTRRIGYAYSTNGGQQWTSKREIDPGFRLGFPYLQVTEQGVPLIACHGAPDPQGVRTLFYIGEAGSTEFFRAAEFERTSTSGRSGEDGAGVIWPAFVVSPKDKVNPKAVFLASLSFASGEEPAPLHYTVADVGVNTPWKEFGDSLLTSTSGGRYIIATSPGGKIGVASFTFTPNVDYYGIYFSESTDGGTSWSEPTRIFDYNPFYEEFMYNEDVDTLRPDAQLDFAYMGEEPHIVATGTINDTAVYEGIYHWSASQGLTRILVANPTEGIGLVEADSTKVQGNMNWVGYPTISVGNDGQHIVVPFTAAAQTPSGAGVRSKDGFYYFRLWGIGSSDGGTTWGDPFIIQDFAADETDSASIEYPSANEIGAMVNKEFQLSVAFQARRNPGMYAFVTDIDPDANVYTPSDRGPFDPCFQYFQRMMIPPDKFIKKPASVPGNSASLSQLEWNRILPNPARSQVVVEFSVAPSARTTVELFNALGDRVMTVVDGENLYPGVHSRTIDVGALPSGTYRLVLTQDGTSVSHQLNVVR